MPAYRNLPRRSRRLSNQEPRNYDEAEWESYKLMYPTPEPEITALSPPDTPSFPLSTSCSGSGLPSVSLSSEACGPSHSRRRMPGHIPRPPNAFMLFRSDLWKKQKSNPVERDHRHISRIAGHCWNELSDQERGEYKKLADKRKLLHANEYPGYKYTPVFRKEKPVKRKVKRDGDGEEERCRKVALLLMEGMEGTDLERAVKNMEEEQPQKISPSPRFNSTSNSTLSTPLCVPSRTRAPKLQAAHPRPIKVETSQAVELATDNSLQFSDQGFVPTSQIPPLELSTVKKEEKTNNEFDRSLRPPSYDCIDTQFGFRAEAMPFVRDSFLPHMIYTEDGQIPEDESSPMLISSESDLCSIDNSIGFDTPFDFEQIEIGRGPVFFEQIFDNPISPTTEVEPAPVQLQDFNISSYIT